VIDLREFFRRVGACALSGLETLDATYKLSRLACESLPGDLVECGVFGGAQVAMMARAYLDVGGLERRVHLFDTFAGIPEAGEHDIEFLVAQHKAGLSACSRATVESNLIAWELYEYSTIFEWHEGLFADTVPKAHFPNGIALLRLDGDLYQSTRDALGLYKHVVPGGWIIADDYRLSGCRRAIYDTIGEIGPVMWRKEIYS
jgi:O-methyltransferase